MNRTLLLLIQLVLCSRFIHAQTGFEISGLPITADRQVIPYEYQYETLKWGKVVSECIPATGAGLGSWFVYKAKGTDLTIVVKTGQGMGDITEPMIYLGMVEMYKGQERLKEVACVKGEKGRDEVSLSVNTLSAKNKYYLLVTSARPEKKQRFAMELKEVYEPSKKEDLTASKTEKLHYIIGRVRKSNGDPRHGVEVTLLNEKLEPLQSTKTDLLGSFRFEKLPPEHTYITRIEEDDSELIVDMFRFDEHGNVSQRATRVGTSLYGFGAETNGFEVLKLLTEIDWRLDVKAGKSGVTGRIVDGQTFLFGQKDVEVGLYNNTRGKMATSKTDVNGRFAFRDIETGDYFVKIEDAAEGTYSEMVIVDDLNVPYLYTNSTMIGTDGFFKFEKLPAEVVEMKRIAERDTRMKLPTDFSKMEEGKPIVLKNILFASGSSELLESSFTELDKLSEELAKRTTVRIEISGHTDNTGNENTNRILSENRARAVKDYLVKKGIEESRLVYKGYGQGKPLASNDTEEGRKQNRRVEFVIVK